MQVLGAYGYRGLWEKKQYFIKSIPQAIKNLDWLVRKGVVNEYPYLKDGAHYVHERYDGSGYPEGLKGEEIPEIARIVAVADYYDALTSKKSYRDFYPQPFVREAFVKGYGTLFDPKYAQIMLDLI